MELAVITIQDALLQQQEVTVYFTRERGTSGTREIAPTEDSVDIVRVMFEGVNIMDWLHESIIKQIEEKII